MSADFTRQSIQPAFIHEQWTGTTLYRRFTNRIDKFGFGIFEIEV